MKKYKEFIFKDNKDKIKNNIFNEHNYDFEIMKKVDVNDYSKVYHFINKEYKINRVK